MKRIGIIGGMSFESTLHYYEQINQEVYKRTHGLAFPDLVIRSVNFQEYRKLMEKGDWCEIAHRLKFEALDLVFKNKCEYVAIATNTMHKVADLVIGPHEVAHEVVGNAAWPPISRWINIPLVHIGDCIAEECKEVNAKRVLLLGTEITMTDYFMKDYLLNFGIIAMGTRNYPEEIKKINRIIFEELCHGIVTLESKQFMVNFINQFPADSDERPDAIILGCTELNMILEPGDVDIPLIDSTKAHIDKLVNLCLEN